MLYPTTTDSRTVIDLGGIWDFALDDGTGFDDRWCAAPLADAMTMPVPASYNDLKEGVDIRDHYGWVFYQRTVQVPAALRGQRVVLRADAVTHHARVYLNGELLGEHRGGFLPFEVELDGHLAAGDNLLTIAVDNVIDHTTLPVGARATCSAEAPGPRSPIPRRARGSRTTRTSISSTTAASPARCACARRPGSTSPTSP